ncbi:Na/Pi cotransporter family protein [Listeria seeligeri]|uniref:Na/Pi cotransporter family protein n=1 Tax=Listeria seeligeri TaxID=1640 RepID=UPI0010D24206|nr:Na/Pi cotransporter family protein [Listeria seeligeri]MBC1422441.1 Na/Pi cotransporter family protein [Listeria seeligeri]MBC1425101.1 Na/Pi cotransporter family protein [Listeria seeligeri]MBC1430690.1 Na/Pi cotransporter family protein [Listeria seeligeri]MBC1444562.1 Na/Pi cotransporter family protein [Listeria seeligeri]MBC1472502.1 Na/Pi cotransporter family protein [Listeria seeligeri]
MGDIDIQQMIFQFIGGLGIFLFGIKYMGDGLQMAAGDRLRDILDKYTTNPFMGVLAGILVTVLIQSSSGTTVLTVGLVSAGFMTLKQAIGVIMGANIGTTVTAFIIGIKLSEYALPIIAVGAVLLFFFKNHKVKNIGQVFFGFGALFYGLDLMGQGMEPLAGMESFHELTAQMSTNPFLGLLIGTIFTAVVQSSSATIGILQELYGQGAIDLQAALPVLFGDNIGTTITAILAAIGASVAAKRAAATHVIFNLIGALIFMLILPLFTSFITYLQGLFGLNPEMTIAVAHGTFNVTNTFIQFWFIGAFAWLVTKLIPGDDSRIDYKTKHLDTNLIDQSPGIALEMAREETLRMADYAKFGLQEAREYLVNREPKHAESTVQVEEAVNNLDRKITEYLTKISSVALTDNETEEHALMLDTVRDIERVGDHMENIVENIDQLIKNKAKMSEAASDQLIGMFEMTTANFERAVKAMHKKDRALAEETIVVEKDIDKAERKLRKDHIKRLNAGECQVVSGILYIDIVSDLERIGDHANNIAEAVLELNE